MASKNDITGDKIKTKTISEDYRANYEHVFGKREIFYFSDGTWRELKTLQEVAEAQKNGDEIEVEGNGGWNKWHGRLWNSNDTYRARPRQPKMKQVKMLCWFAGNELHWYGEDVALCGCARVPSEDKTIEIPE